ARMVMRQQDRRGIGEDCGLEDLARMYQRGVEGTDGDGVDADHLILRVEEQDDEVLPIGAIEVLLEDPCGGSGAVDLLPLGGLASVADELHLVDRDAVHGCLRRRVAVVPGSFLHPRLFSRPEAWPLARA